MVKSKEETIAEFNDQVNMTVEELEEWLKNPQSKKAGTGVGLESAAKIIEILKKNPTEDPEKYEDDDLEHMRKVVGYNKRHIAQEDHLKDTKTKEELENTKSTISLKNWGHDPLKTLDETSGTEAADAKVEESTAEGDVPTVPDAKPESETPSESKEVGSKRKHDEAAGAESDSKVETDAGSKDVPDSAKAADKEDEREAVEGNEEDGEGEKRARKKSKTVAESEAATEEATTSLLQ